MGIDVVDGSFMTARIKPMGRAASVPGLVEGMKVVSVNGRDTATLTKSDVMQELIESSIVRFEIATEVNDASTSSRSQHWLHGQISREQASARISRGGIANGRFLVRRWEQDPSIFVLTLGYNGKPTHHHIAQSDDGVYTVNNKRFGEPHTIEQVIAQFTDEHLPKGWPIRLSEAVDATTGNYFDPADASAMKIQVENPGTTSNTDDMAEDTDAIAQSTDVTQDTDTDVATSGVSHLSGGTTDHSAQAEPAVAVARDEGNEEHQQPVHVLSEGRPNFVHDVVLSGDEGKAWAIDRGSVIRTDGQFVLRRHKAADSYVLSVMYKGRLTHHLCERSGDDGMVVNRKPPPQGRAEQLMIC